jgi:plasmid maintenance system antidote protein VapI
MRHHASPRGFARWLGRSESLIRNVENGCAPLSSNLARRIEEKTGVSADWLLNPDAAGSIMGSDGREWSAAEHLDPIAGGELDFRPLLLSCPQMLPALVGKLVEARLGMELEEGGSSTSLTRTLALLRELGPLTDAAFEQRFLGLLSGEQAEALLEMWRFAKLAAQGKPARR